MARESRLMLEVFFRPAHARVGDETGSRFDSAQANLDFPFGTAQRDASAAGRAAASQDAQFRQVSDST